MKMKVKGTQPHYSNELVPKEKLLTLKEAKTWPEER